MGLLGEHVEDFKKMIGIFDDFKPRMQRALKRLRSEFEGLKSNMSDWIIFLDRNQIEMQEKVSALERRIEDMERRERQRVKLANL
ncbi:hypothetical protein KY335_03840 [Candidatus Woesearchaeota archaeon]|nr:hypothetical protein [Candidatus Woesearchaeota archaeon]